MAEPVLQWLVENGYMKAREEAEFRGDELSQLAELRFQVTEVQREARETDNEGAAEMIETYNKNIRTIVENGKRRAEEAVQ